MEYIDMKFDENSATFVPPEQPQAQRPKQVRPSFNINRIERPEPSSTPPQSELSEYGERFRIPDLTADVLVPLAQVAVVGILSLIVWLFVLHHVEQPRYYAIPIAAMTMLAQWLATLREERHRNPVVERVERSAETAPPVVPASAAPRTPDPEPVREITFKEVRENGSLKGIRRLELPKKIDEKMPRVAYLVVVMNVNFSRPELHKQHKALSQGEFRTLSKMMREAGFARVSASNQTEITPAGKSFLRDYLGPQS